MLDIIIMLVLSSLWSLIINDYLSPLLQLKDAIGMGRNRTVVSDYIVLDYILYLIHKLINCSMCLSFHIFWISYLIIYDSWFGIMLAPISYFITFIIKEKLLRIDF